MPPLSYRDRFLLAWELTWPLAVVDFAVVLVLHGILNVAGEALDSVWALVVFFVVSPWVIRRAFRRSYGGGRIVVVRDSEAGELRYQESLKVMWLLAWRTLVLMLAALFVISFGLKQVGLTDRSLAIDSPLANALGLSLVDSITSILFTPLVIPAMLRKRYRGFHLKRAEIL